ncbi:MAG: RasGEF domain-containing protein [Chlamydiales bacterium]|nr:RasGEF domain-containing protein [Chlamydiales bacterium]
MSSISRLPGLSYMPHEQSLPELSKQASDSDLKKLSSPRKNTSTLSKMRSVQYIDPGPIRRLESIKNLHSFSPRTSPETIQTMTRHFQAHLEGKQTSLDRFSPVLLQILAFICYNQYAPIDPNNYTVITGLHHAHLLKPCLQAIQYLAGKDSPLFPIPPTNLLKLALQIIEQPFARQLLAEEPTQEAINQILHLSKKYPEELLGFIFKAEDAIIFHKENNRSSLDIAQEGLMLLKRCIHDEKDKEEFFSYEHLHKRPQKLFLFCLQDFFLNTPFRLRLNQLQKESLIQLALSLFLAPDAADLFIDLNIKEIGKRLVALTSHRYLSPRSQRFGQLVNTMLNTPFIPLQGLQLLIAWLQQPLADIDSMFNLAAGTREWDPRGEFYHFVLLRFQEIALQEHSDSTILYRLLCFIHCWEKTPANQDLLSQQTFQTIGQKYSIIRLKYQAFQEEIEQKFLLKEAQHLLCYKQFSLSKVYPNPIFKETKLLQLGLPKKTNPIWKKESAVKDLRDTVVFYLLSARDKVKVTDLILHSKKPAASMIMQAKRFNQVTQFFVKELLALEHSISSALSMIKTLCNLQKELLKYSAFEAAWSVHAVFQQASISRLSRAFSLEPDFFEQFNRPNIWCSQENNFQTLKNLQTQSIETFEVSPLIVHELIHLRENQHEFTNEGKVNVDRLQLFGKLFNDFVIRKQKALRLWTSEVSLDPDLFLVKILDSQSGIFDDEVLEVWWERSQEIHPQASKEYWGEVCETL